MARKKRVPTSLPTIWQCPDDLWDEFIEPTLRRLDPPKKTGRKRIDQRRALNGMIYQLRTGCQWNALPREFGSDRSIHRTMQRWIERGVLDEVIALLIDHCDEFDDVEWEWQSADAAMGKARVGGRRRQKPDGSGQKRNKAQRGLRWQGGSAVRRGCRRQCARHQAS
jgi:putative transposase